MNIYCEFENLKENLNKNEKFLIKKRKEKHNTTITNIEIKCKKLAKAINKDIGKYTTIYCEKFDYLSNSHFDFLVDNLKEEILKLINSFSFKTKNLKYFIVGLGNNKITADSLGYLVTEKILSTTKDIENKKLSKKTFGNAFSIAPSIASKNGIYTSQIILSLCKELKPDIVILVDSLSCRDINFLGKTLSILIKAFSLCFDKVSSDIYLSLYKLIKVRIFLLICIYCNFVCRSYLLRFNFALFLYFVR